jgi:phosphoserine phosphatase
MSEQFLVTIFGSGDSAANRERVRRFFSATASKPRVMEGCSGFILPDDPRVHRNDLFALEAELQLDINLQPLREFETKRRLFVFDMDSTLIQAEVIDELAKLAGVGEQVAAVTASAMRGEIDFNQSFTHRISLLRGLPVTKVRELVGRIALMPGVERLFKQFHAHGVRTAIASGGFTFVARELQQRLGIDHVHTNELDIVDGHVSGKVSGEIIDATRKAELLREIARAEGIPLEQAVAVGDGANDTKMLAAAGTGIAYHAKPVLREAAKLRITHGPIDAALHLVTL